MQRARGIVTKYCEGYRKWRKTLRTNGISAAKKWDLNNKSFANENLRERERGTKFRKDLLNFKEWYGEKDGTSDMMI